MGDRPKRRRPTGAQTIGGIIAGFEQQVLRTTPPPHELVRKGEPVRGVSGENGGELRIDLPEPAGAGEPPADR